MFVCCLPTKLLLFVFTSLYTGHFALAEVETSSSPSPLGAVCKLGSFLCNITNTCLEQRKICNGQSDCPDGSDELGCNDHADNKYYDYSFSKRPEARLDDLDSKCVLPYNGTCRCKGKSLFCDNQNLTKAPDDLPDDEIYIMDFTGNVFDTLSQESLRALPLDVDILVLKHCSITDIKNGTFFRLSSMTELELDNNGLKVFPKDIFPKDTNLEKLVLSYNEIERIEDGAFDDLTDLHHLKLDNNKLKEIKKDLFQPLVKLETLILRANKIRSIEAWTFPQIPLETLSVDDNQIEIIASYSFASLPTLQNLFLSNNKIEQLVNGTFENLTALQGLKLNHNRIKLIENGVFIPTYNLSSLDLAGNPFRSLNSKVLQPLVKLKHIYFHRFELCYYALHVRDCHPKGDGISSFSHLLDNPVLRASVWIMGIVGCVGNLFVFLGRLLTPTTNKVHSLYIKNLALSDLLMGVYLLTIASVDYHYRGVYLKHQSDWRKSSGCSICGFLSTLSCESSVLILSLVTWDRFISITQPLARRQPSAKTAGFTLTVLWLTAIILAVLPLLPSELTNSYFGKGNEFYGNNGVCLSLHIHEPYANGWEYAAAMFICINTLALAFICYAYLRMIHEIRASGIACRSTQQSQERDKVAQRFGVIVLTDCLCWVPVICVKLAVFFVGEIPDTLYAWLAILVLPINSALNPVLYTLTTTVFKKQMRKVYNSCVHKRTRPEHQNSGYDSSFSLSFGIFPLGGSTKRTLTYRGTQSSLASSKNSWRRSTAV